MNGNSDGLSMLSRHILDPADFTEEQELGSGSFASVFLCRDKRGQPVAVKKVTHNLKRTETQTMFVREVSILLSLQHPTILHLVGYSLPSERYQFWGLYTEFMPNGTLQQALDCERNGNPTPGFDATVKAMVAYGVAAGMKYCHEKRLVHRDLKPENIFFDNDFEPKIADFGLAKMARDVLVMSGSMGTPYYMAPELFHIENESKVSNAIDVYAYGMIVLSLFTKGKLQFSGMKLKSLAQLAVALDRGSRYDIPATTPPEYRELITKCWDGKPSERPTFEHIVEYLEKHAGCIEGTDQAKLEAYKHKLRSWKPAVSSRELTSTKSDSSIKPRPYQFL